MRDLPLEDRRPAPFEEEKDLAVTPRARRERGPKTDWGPSDIRAAKAGRRSALSSPGFWPPPLQMCSSEEGGPPPAGPARQED